MIVRSKSATRRRAAASNKKKPERQCRFSSATSAPGTRRRATALSIQRWRRRRCHSFVASRTTIHTMLSLTARTTTRSARALFVARRGYHENIVEHYENPRNVGSLDKTDEHVGTVGDCLEKGEVSCDCWFDCWLVEQHDACRMHGRFMHDA